MLEIHKGQYGFTGWCSGESDPIYEAFVGQLIKTYICLLPHPLRVCLDDVS